ncbi:MAG: hypothetical protein PUG18_08955 [Lachnospiraceae bacterium]|jgi:lipopolysaccharide export LptBFGC system permease protein LptF|nr:hypothetical protein [Lachnospiraceae bacterium]
MNEEYFRSDYYTGATERADDMIRANGAAEAREAEHLRSTAAEYSSEIEELKKLYEKNSALVEQLRAMNEETARNTLKSVQDASAQITQSAASFKDIDLAGMQQQIAASVEDSRKTIADLMQQSDDFAHKENVRVYRNIQAATDQLLQKQTQELKDGMETLKEQLTPKKQKASAVSVLTLLLVILCLAYEVLDSFGVISMIVRMIIGG